MTAGDLAGMVVSSVALCLCFVAVVVTPPLDDSANEKAQRLAEARMKARIFTKFPDRDIASMSAPVKPLKDSK